MNSKVENELYDNASGSEVGEGERRKHVIMWALFLR